MRGDPVFMTGYGLQEDGTFGVLEFLRATLTGVSTALITSVGAERGPVAYFRPSEPGSAR